MKLEIQFRSGSSAAEPSIFLAGFDQRRRRAFVQSLCLVAHPIQVPGKRVAVTLASQTRVCRLFIDPVSAQPGQPRFNVPARDDDDHGIFGGSPRYALSRALPIQLGAPVFGRVVVRIDDDDKKRFLPCPNRPQLPGIPLSNPLIARLCSMGKRKRRDVMVTESAAGQESTHEAVRLPVLAEQNDPCAHPSQPLATVSESDSPSTAYLGSVLARTGPSPCRENHLPPAPAM